MVELLVLALWHSDFPDNPKLIIENFIRCKYITLMIYLYSGFFFFESLTNLIFANISKPTDMTKKDRTYRESIEEIETILEKIENGETDIDDLTDEIKHAARLLQRCKEKLFRTEQEVEKIVHAEEKNKYPDM